MPGDSRPTVAAYVRPQPVRSRLDDRLAALERLAAQDRIASLDVVPWPAEIPYSDEPPTGEFLEAYRRFRRWATDAGVELHPPFEHRHVSSMFTGESDRLLLPAFCIAVAVDGRLVGVFPHGTGADHASVDDAIARLERGELAPGEPETIPSGGESDRRAF